MAGKAKVLKRFGWGFLALAVAGVGFLFLTEPGKAYRDIWRTGAVQAAIAGTEMRQYNATTEANLRAIHTALMMYHDSEGQFPLAEGWMDAIQNRIGTADMEGSEAQKKLISPSLQGQPNQFGYAMNDKASGKYKDDLDPNIPLVFDSSDTSRNAHGSPEKLAPNPPRAGQNLAISVSGKLQKL
ncbi:MAG: hypothetical protein ACAH95_09500 [Fimbriimonas sp.]